MPTNARALAERIRIDCCWLDHTREGGPGIDFDAEAAAELLEQYAADAREQERHAEHGSMRGALPAEPIPMVHDWVAHEREGWTVCSRCGMVRNYRDEIPACRGALPKVRPRAEQPEPAEQQAETPAPAKPVCSTCCDTHRMTLHEREVMCTRCPVPCERCRSKPQGPYCAVTPCPCECHRKGEPANSPEIPDGSDLDKTYRDSDGRECSLDVMCMREPGWAASVIRTLQQRVWSEQSLVRKLDADYSAARVGIMALVGELHEHLALMVRYLEEETSQGDGIQERHWDGYQGAKSVLMRTAPNQPSWENAQLEIHEARHELAARRALDADVRACADIAVLHGSEHGHTVLAADFLREPCPECHMVERRFGSPIDESDKEPTP